MEENINQSTPQGNKTGIIVLILAAIIIIAGGLWYAFSGTDENTNNSNNTNTVANENSNTNVNANTAVNTNTETNSNTNTATNINSSVDTSDWLTYTNEEYGFSIMYPDDWDKSYYTNPSIIEQYSYALLACRTSYDNSNGTRDYGEIIIYGYSTEQGINLENWINTNRPLEGEVIQDTFEQTTIAGYESIKRIATNSVAGGYINSTFIYIDSAIIEIQTNSRILTSDIDNQKDYDDTVLQVLDSFRK